jgi:hypothetical protein
LAEGYIIRVHVQGGTHFDLDADYDYANGDLDGPGEVLESAGEAVAAIRKAINAGNSLATVARQGKRSRVLIVGPVQAYEVLP